MISNLYTYHKHRDNYIISYEEFKDFIKEKLDRKNQYKRYELFESLGYNDITEMKQKNNKYLNECKRKNDECEKTQQFNILCEKESLNELDTDEKN
jgi:hypothetical protein